MRPGSRLAALGALVLLARRCDADDDTSAAGKGNETEAAEFWRRHHAHPVLGSGAPLEDAGSESGIITLFGRTTADAVVFRPDGDQSQRSAARRLSDEVPVPVTRCARSGPMDAVEDNVERFMREYHVEGASLAYRLHDGTTMTRAFGIRRPDEPMTVDTTMRLASLSKPLTAAAVMLLVQNGQLDLDELAFDALKHLLYDDQKYADYKMIGFEQNDTAVDNLWRKVTVRHLLEHTAGWPSNVPSRDPIMMAFDLSAQDLVPWTIDNVPLDDEPGTKFHYSNFGYLLLGRLIEARANTSYEEFVREQVLRPCGVSSTMFVTRQYAPAGFQQSSYFASMESPFSVGPFRRIHDYALNSTQIYSGQVPIERADAALGWVGRPIDYLQFLNCMDHTADGMQLLNDTSMRLMHRRSSHHAGFGMGWTLPNDPGDFAHFGALPGTAAYARHWHRPGANTVVVLNRRHEVPSLAEERYRSQLIDFHTRMATLLRPNMALEPHRQTGRDMLVFGQKKKHNGPELHASLNVADKHFREEEFRL